VGGWIDPSGGSALSREQIEDLLGTSFASPNSTLSVAYDDAGNRFTHDLNLAHSNVWTAEQYHVAAGGSTGDEEVLRAGASSAVGVNAAVTVLYGPTATTNTSRRNVQISRVINHAAAMAGFSPNLSVLTNVDAVQEASAFTASTVGVYAESALGATTPIKASHNVIGVNLDIRGLSTGSEESSAYFGLSKDNSATGQPHARQWFTDFTTEGNAFNEQQTMCHGISMFVNNHFDGQPSVADAVVFAGGTGKTGGANPHGTDTYPLMAVLGAYGVATNTGGATKAYGAQYGVKAGQINGPWGNVSKFKQGVGSFDWGQYGFEVGARYTGAAETNPFGGWIAGLGLSLAGFLALRKQDLALVNGVNNDIAVTGTTVRITGPTAAFSISSIAATGYTAPQDGMEVTIINTTAFAMTITNAAAVGTATNRILTALAGDRIGTATHPSSITVVYDATAQRWREKSWSN
jgi:hypothetical protein